MFRRMALQSVFTATDYVAQLTQNIFRFKILVLYYVEPVGHAVRNVSYNFQFQASLTV